MRDRVGRLRDRHARHVTQSLALYAIGGLFKCSEEVTREEFKEFKMAVGVYTRARSALG